MYYRIEFFESKITAAKWEEVIELFRKKLKYFRLFIRYENAALHFYLETSKNPHSLNAAIHPLHIGSVAELMVPVPKRHLLSLFFENLLELIIKRSTKLESSQQSAFWIRIGYGIGARFHRALRSFVLINRSGDGWESVSNLLPINTYRFLEIDLSKSSDLSLDKAKPKLQNAIDTSLPYDRQGSLSLAEQPEQRIDLAQVDFWRHSLVVGQSGSGKSEFLKLFVKELYYRGVSEKHGIVIVDPHGRIYDELKDTVSCACLHPSHHAIDFFETCENPLAAAELSIDLLESQLAGDVALDIRGKRVLRFSLFLLYSTKNMSYDNLARLLSEASFRLELLKQVSNSNVQQFFETEFMELKNRHYDTAILPILNIVSEYQLASQDGQPVSLLDVVNSNSILAVSLPQGELGSRLVKLYGATLIQQLFLSAQAGKLKRPLVVLVDEVALVYTPAFDKILAESRKFGIGICSIQQYLSQIPKSGLDSIFANTSNYFCFRTNRLDAGILAENLNLQINLISEDRLERSHRDLAASTLSDLSVGELIAKLTISGKNTPATKLKTDLKAWKNLEEEFDYARSA